MPMTPISAQELASIQQDAYEATCDLPCIIQRGESRTPLPSGGATTTPTVVSNPYPLVGMSQPTAGQLQNFGYLVGTKAAWQVKMHVLAPAQEMDTLIIQGEKLEVVKDLTPRSYPALLTLLCAEVT